MSYSRFKVAVLLFLITFIQTTHLLSTPLQLTSENVAEPQLYQDIGCQIYIPNPLVQHSF